MLQVGVPEAGKPLTFDHMSTVCSSKSIIGSYIGSRTQMINMLDLVKLHNIYPFVEIYEFEDFPKAYHRMSKEKPHFRVVVDVAAYHEKHKK